MKAGGTGQPVGHRGDSSLKEKPDWRLGTGDRGPLSPCPAGNRGSGPCPRGREELGALRAWRPRCSGAHEGRRPRSPPGPGAGPAAAAYSMAAAIFPPPHNDAPRRRRREGVTLTVRFRFRSAEQRGGAHQSVHRASERAPPGGGRSAAGRVRAQREPPETCPALLQPRNAKILNPHKSVPL